MMEDSTPSAGQTIRLTQAALLDNDSDVDGDALVVTGFANAVGGTVQRAANGDILFTASAGFSGAASFSYSVSDGAGGSDTALVRLSVSAPPPPSGLTLTGNDGRDTLIGGSGNDSFYGKKGNDVLIGKSGNDTFHVSGDDGLDTIVGGDGYDQILGGAANDTIRVARVLNLKSVEEIDGGSGGFDVITGTTTNDVLNFGRFKLDNIDLISLGAGNDWVSGSRGNDVFSGGAGRDIFYFTPMSGRDIITDFNASFDGQAGSELINLRCYGFRSYAQIVSQMTQWQGNTTIKLDANASVTLMGVTIQELGSRDFVI